MYSPWGHVDRQQTYAPGIVEVSTPGHGGLMIREDVALARLSEASRKRGMRYNGYVCFEEDVQWQIAIWELSDIWPAYFRHAPAEMAADPRSYLLRTLSSWQADFLLEIGVTPDPDGYATWQERQRAHEMRAAKHPDLIVAAFGESHTKAPGVYEVMTADEARHRVTAASYNVERDAHSDMPLLSRCEVLSS